MAIGEPGAPASIVDVRERAERDARGRHWPQRVLAQRRRHHHGGVRLEHRVRLLRRPLQHAAAVEAGRDGPEAPDEGLQEAVLRHQPAAQVDLSGRSASR